MYFSHISIGGGVTGIETIISAFTKIQEELIKSQRDFNQIGVFGTKICLFGW